MLPRRWWPRLDDHVPATSSALPAGLVTIAAAAIIGIPGFLKYVGYTSAASAGAAIRIVEENIQSRPDLDNAAAMRHMAVSMNALSIFFFLLTTPVGLLTMYLAVSGVVRTAGALVNDPHGDFMLTLADYGIRRGRTRHRQRAGANRRLALEGMELPDRIVTPAQAGIAGCDMVLVCSRRKPGWDGGTVLLTDEGAYRVGAIEERTMGGWLRTLYALTEHRDQEAIRRAVRYNLPKRG